MNEPRNPYDSPEENRPFHSDPTQGPVWTNPPQPPSSGADWPPYPPYGNESGNGNRMDNFLPYQYSPNSGWKQSGQTQYEWRASDYEHYDRVKKGKRHPQGFVVFLVCMVGSLSLGLATVAALSFLQSPISRAVDTPAEAAEAAETPLDTAESALTSGDGISIAFDLSSRPQVSETLPVGGRMSIPEVAEYVSPSVVSVIKYRENQIYSEATGIGSGIILSEDGYIVTNAHVIEGGSSYKVQLSDGTPYDARLVGGDTATDLAVLKVEAEGLRPAQFGNSDELLVGETVVAIGNPVDLTFAGSVTQGIISAVNREVSTSRYSMPYIQTDAAINPGNSGGALANEFGQVIGINSAKIFRAGYEGMGFAIPISEAKPIIDDLLMYGWVTGRVKLGIEGLPIDAVDAARADLVEGVIIKVIDPSSDLNNHNILKDDVITHVNGTRVYTTSDIHNAIDGFTVGDEVELSIFRRLTPTSASEFTVTVKLVEAQE